MNLTTYGIPKTTLTRVLNNSQPGIYMESDQTLNTTKHLLDETIAKQWPVGISIILPFLVITVFVITLILVYNHPHTPHKDDNSKRPALRKVNTT